MGIIHIRKGSITDLSLHFIQKNRAAVNRDIQQAHGLNCKVVSKALIVLLRKRLIDRLEFRTDAGPIFYMPGYEKAAWKYGIEKKLIPGSAPVLLGLARKYGVISNLDIIYRYKATRDDLFWIRRHLVRQAGMIRCRTVEQIILYYYDEKLLADYMESPRWKRLKRIQTRRGREKQQIGNDLERLVMKIYKRMGFSVRRHAPFFDPVKKSYVFIDILAERWLDKDRLLGKIKIAVECKNRSVPITGTDIFKLHCLTTNIPYLQDAQWHIYSTGGISYWLFYPQKKSGEYFWLSSFPRVKVFGMSQIKKICTKARINYKPVKMKADEMRRMRKYRAKTFNEPESGMVVRQLAGSSCPR
jgi:hypothetical protein